MDAVDTRNFGFTVVYTFFYVIGYVYGNLTCTRNNGTCYVSTALLLFGGVVGGCALAPAVVKLSDVKRS